MRVFLVGYMGAGKTTIGKALARKLGFKFIDLDHAFEEKYKISISLFFSKYDQKSFRKLESELLNEYLAVESYVISTGGGLPCFFDNMDKITEYGAAVYLKLSPKALLHRLTHSKKTRPLIQDKNPQELIEFIETQLKERELYYNRAQYIVDGINLDLDSLVRIIKEDFNLS
ncbi:MAG: shikimate kinase [Bacteroidales bacterium]|nr:shikimate kinase [Bacteroidales bacterium]